MFLSAGGRIRAHAAIVLLLQGRIFGKPLQHSEYKLAYQLKPGY